MNASNRVVLIVDPALMSAEAEAYNHFEEIAEEVRSFNGCADFSLRFWLPKLGGQGPFDRMFRSESMQKSEVIGCISLGSYAHVTEEKSHPWMAEFEKLLLGFLAPSRVPFFGICFAHQYLAWKAGWEAVRVPSQGPHAIDRYVSGQRQVVLTDPRFALLLADLSSGSWNAHSTRSAVVRWAYSRLRQGQLRLPVFNNPQAKVEWGLRGVLSDTEPKFIAHARHFQMVRPRGRVSFSAQQNRVADADRLTVRELAFSRPGSPTLVSAGYGVEPGGYSFEHDAIVHEHLPWFTVQTHPERPLTASSRRLLRNFFLLCLSPTRGETPNQRFL
jgi:hypothetical protein